jgi:hypothetical protein
MPVSVLLLTTALCATQAPSITKTMPLSAVLVLLAAYLLGARQTVPLADQDLQTTQSVLYALSVGLVPSTLLKEVHAHLVVLESTAIRGV